MTTIDKHELENECSSMNSYVINLGPEASENARVLDELGIDFQVRLEQFLGHMAYIALNEGRIQREVQEMYADADYLEEIREINEIFASPSE